MKEWSKKLRTYLFAAYGLIWGIFVLFIVVTATKLIDVSTEGESYFMDGVKILISWVPTMAVIFFRQKLFPGKSLKEVFDGMFAEKLNMRLFFFVLLLQIGTSLTASVVSALWDGVPVFSQWSFSWQFFVYSFFFGLLSGATGEESGWHGFLFPHLMEKYGCIRSSFIVGIIWGLWHIPLWIVASFEFGGWDLVLYIVQFMVCTISWSLVMDILYYWNRNLIIVVTFHFMVNFMLSLFSGNDLVFQNTTAIMSVLVAVGFVIAFYRKGRISVIE